MRRAGVATLAAVMMLGGCGGDFESRDPAGYRACEGLDLQGESDVGDAGLAKILGVGKEAASSKSEAIRATAEPIPEDTTGLLYDVDNAALRKACAAEGFEFTE